MGQRVAKDLFREEAFETPEGAGKVENRRRSAPTEPPCVFETPAPQGGNAFKVIDTIVNPRCTIAKDRNYGSFHDTVHLGGGKAVVAESEDKFRRAAMDILAFMGHVTIKAHADAKVFKRLGRGYGGEGLALVDKMRAEIPAIGKIASCSLSFNNRHRYACPVTKLFEAG
jgi:hypothetical protein